MHPLYCCNNGVKYENILQQLAHLPLLVAIAVQFKIFETLAKHFIIISTGAGKVPPLNTYAHFLLMQSNVVGAGEVRCVLYSSYKHVNVAFYCPVRELSTSYFHALNMYFVESIEIHHL